MQNSEEIESLKNEKIDNVDGLLHLHVHSVGRWITLTSNKTIETAKLI